MTVKYVKILHGDDMKISVLASGSTGNAIYIEHRNENVLVDMGLTGKALEEKLETINRATKDITRIFVSHEHRDHCSGVGVVARKYGIPIYANEKTWKGMDRIIGEIPEKQINIFETGDKMKFGSLEVESFPTSHDSKEAMFFVFYADSKKVVTITDTGYVSDRVKETIINADCYVFESNHDENMVRVSGYPWKVQQRILSDSGHLSNTDAAVVLSEIIGDKTKRVFLAHLSKENNYKELAFMTVEQVLKEKGCPVGEQFFLSETDPIIPTKLFDV